MPSAFLLYQYFYPDDVVSSIHMTELAEGLARRGWNVTALPSNRGCRNETDRHSRNTTHNGVTIHRIWRPSFPQSSGWGRIANSAWIVCAWSLKALTCKPDLLIIGTDPILSAFSAIPWKLLRRGTRTVNWCFDLYPEAALAAGVLKPGLLLSALQRLMQSAYKRFDLIADLGDCMRNHLAKYRSPADKTVLLPWALSEPHKPLPTDSQERCDLFGDARLAIMYSGNFGRAHSHSEFLTIARSLRDVSARFVFSIRGNRAAEVVKAVEADDQNISFVPFAPQERLNARLSAADIHVVSLREEWTGVAVPSKFFGAIAAGRPVLFIGSKESYVAKLIEQHNLGWVCPPGAEANTAHALRSLLHHPAELKDLSERCHRFYHAYCSREAVLDRFDKELRSLVARTDERVGEITDYGARSQTTLDVQEPTNRMGEITDTPTPEKFRTAAS